MQHHLRPALVLILGFTLTIGCGCPLAIATISALEAANGSLISRDNEVIGSPLVGRRFSATRALIAMAWKDGRP